MEQTQLLEWEEDGDPPGGDTDGGTLRPVGRLHLLSSKYGPEQDFWIYPGENVVGRLPSCRVCLPAPSVSKAHAVIEVPAPDGPHLLYDRGSLNRTRRQRAVLLPHVRYSLTHGDTLMFGDVGCQYFLMPPEGADPEDSLEVPPTQPRPPAAALAIEETPAPSKRMGYGALLARDSEDEEDPQSVGKVLHLPGSDGSDSPADAGARSQATFLSPSATVVPESDEEGGETPDGPCPPLRLRYESERTPSPPENGLAELPRATGVAGTDPEPALAACHLVRGPSPTGIVSAPGRGPADPLEGRAVGGLGNGCPVRAGSDPAVQEAVQHPEVDPKSRSPAIEVGSDTDVEEEAAGSPDVAQHRHQHGLPGGGDAEEVVAAENPDVPPRGQQLAGNGDSDTDAEAAPEHPDVLQGRKRQPAAPEDSDTDVEEAGGNPDVVGSRSHQPSVEVGSDTDVEEAGGNPDVVGPKNHQPSVEVGSDTDVDEAGGNPDVVGPKNHQLSVEVGSDTDVEEAGGNPDAVAAEGHPLALDEGSNTDVEEAGDPGVAANASVPAIDVGSDTDVEEEAARNPDVVARNPDVVTKSHRYALPGSRDTDVAGPVGKPDVRPTHHRPAENDGSDTDVEEAAGSPAVAQKSHQPSAEVGGDTDVEEAEGKLDVGRQREPAVAGDSDTDVEENLDVGQQTLRRAAADSDTDVEEASGVELGRAPGPMRGPAQRRGEEQPAPQSRVSPEAKVVDTEDTEEPTWGPGEESETDVEDDADFALQATQCYLPEEAPCPGAEPTRAPAPADSGGSPEEEATQRLVFRSPAQGSVMSPPAGPALLAPVCTSSEKEEDSEEEPCAVEATQAFCQDPGRPSEQPPQPLAPEEEETQLLLPQASPGGALSPERARPAVPSPASVGLLPLGAQAPPPAPGPEEGSEAPGRTLPAGGAGKEALEEETQPVRLVLSAPRRPALAPQGEGTQAGAKPGGGSSGQRARSRRGPGGPEAVEQGEAAAAAGVTEAKAQPPGAQPEGAGKVPEARPSPPLPVRRRSLRSTPVPAPPPPTPERRSRRGGADRGCPREEEPVGPAEPSPAAPQRKGRRQLCSPAVYMDAPEPGSVGAKEVEPPVPVKRPRRGPGTQDPPTEPEASSRGALGRARRSRGAAGTEPGPADEPSGGSGGVEPAASQGRARRSQRAPAREPAAGRRGAPERGGKGREMPTPDPPQAQGRRRAGGARTPEDAGSCISKKEAPAPPLRRQSTENTAEGPRARPSRRSQGASGGVASPRVLFTGVIDEAGERVVAALGGALAQSVFDCTHLVTDRVRRTVKFLCALARGVPIVTLDWLDKSGRSACFLSPSSFLVRDAEQEQNFHFSLAQSLQRARRGPLLQGYEIHVTPNVKPEPEHMKDIIQCSGGAFLPHMPRAYKDKRLVISCPEDLPRCRTALSARLPIASAEFLLTGILQQAVDLVSYRLDGPPAPPLPSAPAPSTRGSKRKGASGPAPAAPSTAKRRR